jgi:hypothetical protein
MTEIFIVALPDLQYFFVKLINWSFILVAILLMRLLPVLELVVPRAIESCMTIAALEQSLFLAELAGLGLRSTDELLGHFNF